jgi:hypothetical protein
VIDQFATPFDDDIASAAPTTGRAAASVVDARLDVHVPGPGDHIVERVAAEVHRVSMAMHRGVPNHTRKCLLIEAPGAGFGKTHTLARLRQRLSGLAVTVPLRWAPAAGLAWQSVLASIIDTLTAPLSASRYVTVDGGPARPPMAHLDEMQMFGVALADAALATVWREQPAAPPATVPRRRTDAPRAGVPVRDPACPDPLQAQVRWREIDRLLADETSTGLLVRRLRARGVVTRARLGSWLRLFHTLCSEPDVPLREACLDWLIGLPVEAACAQHIGLAWSDVPVFDADDSRREAVARDRVMDLGCLASLYQPFLLALEVDASMAPPALAAEVGQVVARAAEDPGAMQMLVLAEYADWRQMSAHWSSHSLARVRRPSMQLSGFDTEQARKLIQGRLQVSSRSAGDCNVFIGDGTWLHALFADGELGPRTLLQACAYRWRRMMRPAAASSGTVDLLCGEPLAQVDLASGTPSSGVDVLVKGTGHSASVPESG